jgi:hypothetical protein
MALYTWRFDPDYPPRIDYNGLLTVTIEELADGIRQTPKRIFTASIGKDFGTPAEIWAELKILLKSEVKSYIVKREEEATAQTIFTHDKLQNFEDYLKEG